MLRKQNLRFVLGDFQRTIPLVKAIYGGVQGNAISSDSLSHVKHGMHLFSLPSRIKCLVWFEF